jgi:LysM repeat protein
MKKLFLLLSILFFIDGFVFAQNTLMLRSNEKGVYLDHTVSPKESFYSVGRLYNVAPKELAAFNHLDMNHGLNVGQQIQVPLTSQNFSQTVAKGAPVYYHVKESEGLYRVSVNSNKVPLANLRKWNNLAGDNITVGSNLVVGYLTSGEILAKANVSPPVANEPPPAVVAKNEKTAEVKTEIVKEKPAEETKPEIEKTKPVAKATQQEADRQTTLTPTGSGYFKTVFSQQVKTFPLKKEATVTSGIFKTASGWQDGKYYMLIDNVEPGMIVKITNPSNGKVIYAKVLGQMSGIRQNEGLDIRMSNSAASVLDIKDDNKFIVQVNY